MSTNQSDYLVVFEEGARRSHICRIYGNALCREHGDAQANAHLISAAPDLLSALKVMVENGGIGPTSMFDYASWAIAKAEGKTK